MLVHDRPGDDDLDGGFPLDGYPRTTAQVDYLDAILADDDQKLDIILQQTRMMRNGYSPLGPCQ